MCVHKYVYMYTCVAACVAARSGDVGQSCGRACVCVGGAYGRCGVVTVLYCVEFITSLFSRRSSRALVSASRLCVFICSSAGVYLTKNW